MRYYPRLDLYKASNVSYHPASHSAYSYHWWQFVACIKGELVFNNYRYSNTTARHQYKVKRLLNNLGLEIDVEVEVPKGLQYLKTMGEVKELESAWLKRKAKLAEEKRLERNRKARERRAQRQLEVCS